MPKMKCAFPDCKHKIKTAEIVLGTCRCEKVFCLQHRLPESHDCQVVFQLNKDKFIKENKCVSIKIDAI
jgi:predicted nucleic acid binding AN1-type Zn finger protein